jgi:membrane protein DedA with SNARE-associated domain
LDFSFLPDSVIAHCLTLFFGSFLQEDLAVVTGGIFVINKKLPYFLAFISLYAGIIVSDFGIFGLGVAARSIPWTRKYLVNNKVHFVKAKLEKNIIPSVALCRLCPGLLFPTFVACGWLGISFFHFAMITVVAAALYALVLLFLVTTIGATIVQQIGVAGWVILITLSLSIIIYKAIRASKLQIDIPDTARAEHGTDEVLTLSGMPTYTWKESKVAFSEKIPPILFYLPVGIQWLVLGLLHRSITLPTISNPHIIAGGLWGESKSDLLNQISSEHSQYIATFVTIQRTTDAEKDITEAFDKMRSKGITFPLVAKPDIGWQGYGVKLLDTEDELRAYIRSYPVPQSLIIQKYIPFNGEAGVFYIRVPGEEKGHISSLTFRYYPYVIGDGKSTVKELIQKDERTSHKLKYFLGDDHRHAGIDPELLSSVPELNKQVRLAFIGSLRVGGTYRDGSSYITDALTERFDKIVQSMPPFHFGRFDIRFESIDKLQHGENFAIIEVNGAGSEAIHIWDINKSLGEIYKILFGYQALLFRISAINRKAGYKQMGLIKFLKYSRNYNNLVHSYPRSE